MAVIRVFGKHAGGWGRKRKVSRTARKRKSSSGNKKKTVIHKNPTSGQYPGLAASGSCAALDSANHVVHPTVVRANLPFKRRVNEVRRAATKAKRAAKSTLGRPHKKAGHSKRALEVSGKREHAGGKRNEKVGRRDRPDLSILSPVDSENSGLEVVDTVATHSNGATTVHATAIVAIPSASAMKPKQKESLSSRFSIISFKTFRPKSLSPDKYKITIIDKRRAKSSDKRSKSKTKKQDQRSRSPDKKKRENENKFAVPENGDKPRRNRSPSKRTTMEDERRRPRHKVPSSRSPDKSRRQTLPSSDVKQYRMKCSDKPKLPTNEGNWLIQKFLADEERIAKPIGEGSFRGSVTSMNALINGSCNGSPTPSHIRHGSSRALLHEPITASPVRGIVNEAFLSSPRGARTHSSLRVTKSVSPDDAEINFCSNKYRRSISMEAYNHPPGSPDKRKRHKKDEGVGSDKRRRFSSPEKNANHPILIPRRYEFGDNLHHSHNSASQISSRTGSSHSSGSSHSTSGERGAREKLSVVTATTGGSVVSIMEPTEILETASLHSSGKGILDSGSIHSSSRVMLETASLNSSKGIHDSTSLLSNGRDSGSAHSSSKELPEISSLHSSGKSLLETSSHHSREKISSDAINNSMPKEWS